MNADNTASERAFDTLRDRIAHHLRAILTQDVHTEAARAAGRDVGRTIAWLKEEPDVDPVLIRRLEASFAETPPRDILVQQRIDHAAYTLTTAWSEVLRRNKEREPVPLLTCGLPVDIASTVHRAWDVSLAQIGLTDEEAGAVIGDVVAEVERDGGHLVLPWGGVIVTNVEGPAELVRSGNPPPTRAAGHPSPLRLYRAAASLDAVRQVVAHGGRLTPDEVRMVFPRLAEALRTQNTEVARAIARLIERPCLRVVDVGAGSGIWSLMLAGAGKANEVVGVDIDPMRDLFDRTARDLHVGTARMHVAELHKLAGDPVLSHNQFDRAVIANILLTEDAAHRIELVRVVADTVADHGDILVIETGVAPEAARAAIEASGLVVRQRLDVNAAFPVAAFLCAAFLRDGRSDAVHRR